MDHKTILNAIDDYKALAPAFGVHPTTVSRWKSDGIPPEHWPAVLRMAEAKGLTWITIHLIEACSPVYGKRDPVAQPVS